MKSDFVFINTSVYFPYFSFTFIIYISVVFLTRNNHTVGDFHLQTVQTFGSNRDYGIFQTGKSTNNNIYLVFVRCRLCFSIKINFDYRNRTDRPGCRIKCLKTLLNVSRSLLEMTIPIFFFFLNWTLYRVNNKTRVYCCRKIFFLLFCW